MNDIILFIIGNITKSSYILKTKYNKAIELNQKTFFVYYFFFAPESISKMYVRIH